MSVARLYHADGLEREQVEARLGIKRGDDFARLLKRARDHHLVSVHVQEPTVPPRDRDAEARLRSASFLRRVVAVNCDHPRAWPPTAAGGDPDGSPGRTLHGKVALGAAYYVWERILDGDTIAVGSGRAVRFTADALIRIAGAERSALEHVRITSLCGTPALRRDLEGLDSDDIALTLGRNLRVLDTGMQLMRTPYVADDPAAEMQRLFSSPAGHDWGNGGSPDIAILGLGILDARHHLMASKRDEPMLAPVRAILDQIERLILPASPSAIVDLYDTFWVREGALDAKLTAQAKRLVKNLNAKLVTVPFHQVNQAREKIIVAGGEAKRPAILAYLRQGDALGLRATALVTDAATARELASVLV